MDIDFIKWLCEKTEGVRIAPNYGVPEYCYVNDFPLCEVGSQRFRDVFYPLLLQRAIEGVNRGWRESMKSFGTIKQFSGDIVAHQMNPNPKVMHFYFKDYQDIDTAKESALRYVYEQEKI